MIEITFLKLVFSNYCFLGYKKKEIILSFHFGELTKSKPNNKKGKKVKFYCDICASCSIGVIVFYENVFFCFWFYQFHYLNHKCTTYKCYSNNNITYIPIKFYTVLLTCKK